MQIVRSVNAQTRNASLIKKEIEHLDRAVFVGRRAVDAPLTKGDWNDIWASKKYKVFFARDRSSDIITGYIVIKRTRPKNVYIDTLGVHPEFRTNGIATRLLKQVLRRFPKDKSSLHVSIENEGAIRLYTSMSFEFKQRVKHFYARGDDAFYFQSKNQESD